MMKTKMTTTTAAIMMPNATAITLMTPKVFHKEKFSVKVKKSLSMIFIRMNEINERVKK